MLLLQRKYEKRADEFFFASINFLLDSYNINKIFLAKFVITAIIFSIGSANAATPMIAAGSCHTVALKADGTVWTWGYNNYGQLGDGTTKNRYTPIQVAGLSNIIAIDAGDSHTLALKSDGTVWAWGSNSNGRLGDGTTTNRYSPVQVTGISNVSAIAGGGYHTIVLKTDGTVWAWGSNSNGRLGDGTTTNRYSPVQVTSISNVSAIAAGGSHSVALKSDGTVWAWGYNVSGQLGDGTTTNRYTPVQVTGISNVSAIAGGDYHTIVLKTDGTVWAWGENSSGRLGDGTTTDRFTPVQVTGISNVNAIAAGTDHTIAKKVDGTIWAWGSNHEGQLGDGTQTSRSIPAQVMCISNVNDIAAGTDHTILLKIDGTIWACGSNTYGQHGNGSGYGIPKYISELSNVSAIVAGRFQTFTLKTDGTVWAWGENGYGRLGDGTTTDRKIPVQMTVISNVTAIAAGDYHTLALKEDGTVWAWGKNFYGNLGDGTTTDRYIPVQASGISNIIAIDAGEVHSIALKSDGTVWTWGNNLYGQLGDGTTTDRHIPVQVSGISNIIAIDAGELHSIALKSDGTVWAWGNNQYGQLGDGTKVSRRTPVQVSNFFDASHIECGLYHTIALKSDGTIWTWGSNGDGQLGDGTTTSQNLPVQVQNCSNVCAVTAGGFHSIALKTDSTVWAWGYNDYGQLGDGTSTRRLTPVQVPNFYDISNIKAGTQHSVALKEDSTVWAWGQDEYFGLFDQTKGPDGEGFLNLNPENIIEIILTSPNTGGIFNKGDSVSIQWTTANASPSDNIAIGMKRDSVPPSQTEPDGVNWYRFTEGTPNDGEEPVTIPDGVAEASDWRFYVRHVVSDIWDPSDATFTIANPSLRILTPIEGDSFVVGSYVDIIWENDTFESRCLIKLIQGDPGEIKFQVEVPNNEVCAVPLLSGLCPAGNNYRFCISSPDGSVSDCTGNFSIIEKASQIPASFSFSEISSPQALRTPFPVTITALDEDGNTASGYNDIAILEGPAGPLEPHIIAFKNGVANVNVSLWNYFDTYLQCSAYGATGRSNYYTIERKTGSISGKLVKHNGDPIADAYVHLYDLSKGITTNIGQTNENGFFVIEDIDCGKYNLIITKGEYINETIEEVTIGDGLRTQIGTNTIYYRVSCTDLNCQTPVILIPGIMGSSCEYNSIYPKLPLNPSPSDLHLHDPAIRDEGEAGFTMLRQRLWEEGFIVFDCPYDWRVNLKDAWTSYLKPKIDQALMFSNTGKVHIVAHSMGGLVTRAYIQSSEYQNRNDLDKFIMVGTPNLGACIPYYIWEGGNPFFADSHGNIFTGTSNFWFYSNTMGKMWEDTYEFNGNFNPYLGGEVIKNFVQSFAPSVRELMHTGDFLQNIGGVNFGTSGFNENKNLKNLNNDPNITNLMKNPLTSSEDKIAVTIFAGANVDTISKIMVHQNNNTNGLYSDGSPYDFEEGAGDGTVPYASAIWPCNQGWAELADISSDKTHASLIKDYCESIIDKLRSVPQLNVSAEKNKTLKLSSEESNPLFSVSTNGNVKLFLIDPLNRHLGLSPDSHTLVEEIPGTNLELLVNRGYVEVPNAGNGLYTVIIFSEHPTDFSVRLNYLHSEGNAELKYKGFSGETPVQFMVMIDSSSAEKMSLIPYIDSPEGVQALPYGTENNLLVSLSWLPCEGGIAGYNIYRRSENEPFFKKLTTVDSATVNFNTTDRWEMTAADITCVYAITAFAADGTESLFSNLVRNDDRDLDWITDIDEVIARTDLNNKDTDGDSLEDGREYYTYGTSPLLSDTDADSYSDDLEINLETDPLDSDSFPITEFTITPGSIIFAAAGGTDSVAVDSSLDCCSWTAVSNDAWITVTGGVSSTGDGTVNYSVAANISPARTGTITIAGETFTVNQDAGFNLDIDNNGVVTPFTDGVLILRYLLDYQQDGATWINGAVGANAQRSTAAEIEAYLGPALALLDIDNNGAVTPFTDGVLILRYLLDYQQDGATWINGAVGANAQRTTAAEIEAYINSMMP